MTMSTVASVVAMSPSDADNMVFKQMQREMYGPPTVINIDPQMPATDQAYSAHITLTGQRIEAASANMKARYDQECMEHTVTLERVKSLEKLVEDITRKRQAELKASGERESELEALRRELSTEQMYLSTARAAKLELAKQLLETRAALKAIENGAQSIEINQLKTKLMAAERRLLTEISAKKRADEHVFRVVEDRKVSEETLRRNNTALASKLAAQKAHIDTLTAKFAEAQKKVDAAFGVATAIDGLNSSSHLDGLRDKLDSLNESLGELELANDTAKTAQEQAEHWRLAYEDEMLVSAELRQDLEALQYECDMLKQRTSDVEQAKLNDLHSLLEDEQAKNFTLEEALESAQSELTACREAEAERNQKKLIEIYARSAELRAANQDAMLRGDSTSTVPSTPMSPPNVDDSKINNNTNDGDDDDDGVSKSFGWSKNGVVGGFHDEPVDEEAVAAARSILTMNKPAAASVASAAVATEIVDTPPAPVAVVVAGEKVSPNKRKTRLAFVGNDDDDDVGEVVVVLAQGGGKRARRQSAPQPAAPAVPQTEDVDDKVPEAAAVVVVEDNVDVVVSDGDDDDDDDDESGDASGDAEVQPSDFNDRDEVDSTMYRPVKTLKVDNKAALGYVLISVDRRPKNNRFTVALDTLKLNCAETGLKVVTVLPEDRLSANDGDGESKRHFRLIVVDQFAGLSTIMTAHGMDLMRKGCYWIGFNTLRRVMQDADAQAPNATVIDMIKAAAHAPRAEARIDKVLYWRSKAFAETPQDPYEVMWANFVATRMHATSPVLQYGQAQQGKLIQKVYCREGFRVLLSKEIGFELSYDEDKIPYESFVNTQLLYTTLLPLENVKKPVAATISPPAQARSAGNKKRK
jgi:predicted pyridoxine 5'-phosphate oxidase superfamily flavin-nucleotide-binding protein